MIETSGAPKPLLQRDVDLSWVPRLLAAAARLLWLCTPIVALLALFPWPSQNPDITLDYSWSLVLQHAHVGDFVFGRDMMLNYGSWGFVFFGYLPETRALVMLSWALLSQLFVCGLVIATRSHSRGFFGLACAWTVLLILSIQLPDVQVLVFAPLLFAVGAYETDRRNLLIAEIALALALGWVVTIKFSTFVITVPVLISHTCDQWLMKRRISPVIPIAIAALVLAQFAADQPADSIGDWVASSMQNVIGYGTAAVASDRFHEKHPLPLFVAGAAALGVAMTIHLFRVRRWKSVVALASLALIFGVLLKASYMRHDMGHQINAPLVFLVLVLALAPGMVTKGKRPEQAVFLVAFLIAVYSANLVTNIDRRRDLNITFSEQISATIRGLANFQENEEALREFHDGKMARIRKKFPLPAPIAEPVDIYSYMQSVVFAHGLEYSPRPAFQSYFAWTPALAKANEEHLRSARAPATILFAVEPIDERFPTFDDNLSYPTLLSRYQPNGVTNDFLLLREREVPLSVKLEPFAVLKGRIGQPIEVPRSELPLWATVKVRLSTAGRIQKLVLRPPELRLLATVGGTVENYRFIPDFGEMGFLISPVIRDHYDLKRIFDGAGPGDRALTSLRITAVSKEREKLVEPEVSIELRAIRVAWPAPPGAAIERSEPGPADPVAP